MKNLGVEKKKKMNKEYRNFTSWNKEIKSAIRGPFLG